jgi:trehalose synthase
VYEPKEIFVPANSIDRLGRILGRQRFIHLRHEAEAARHALGGRTVWNVNSTASGGGVAEMLRLLVGYGNGAGVETRWVVIGADSEFYAITKRLHNRLHGVLGDDGELGIRETEHYSSVLWKNADSLIERVKPADVVILHDPQTAGLASRLVQQGARVIWRCHIGTDHPNAWTKEGWNFLQPHLRSVDAFVFSHPSFVPAELAPSDVWIIEPSIDPLSPKNRPLPKDRVAKWLTQVGLLPGDGGRGRSGVLGGASPLGPTDRLVVQVSRWDNLKDMLGVLHGFAEHVAGRDDARLALVGPAVDGVADDPEGARVLAECLDAWAALPSRTRETVRLVALPMDDVEANALMVNATQRHASVVVQKSLEEGFGLTVTESMWKSRPVVASAVGGIVDQIAPGTGVLLDDPDDLDAFGKTLVRLLATPSELSALGRRARRHVRERFLSDRHLIDYAKLLRHVSSD